MKKILLTAIFTCALQAVTFTQSALPKSTATAEGFSPERLARIDRKVQQWVDQKWMTGAVALITRNGKVVYEKAFGYNNAQTKTPMKPDLLFRLASQTKAVTSVGVMILYEEGEIMLDDSVSKYIPEFKNIMVLDKFNEADSTYTTVKANRPITIRDLLTHTSGIGYSQIGSPEANAIYAKNNISAGLGLENGSLLATAMKKLGSLPLMHQPGEKWTYGLNTDLLGYLIEVVSGMNLDQFFRTRIFEPLGMNDTYFYLPKEKQNRLTTLNMEDSEGLHIMDEAFKVNGFSMNPNYPAYAGTYFSGGAGLTATITDYAKFLQMLLNGGTYNGKRILARNTVRMMTTNQVGDLSVGDNKFGLGFSITTEKTAANLPVSVGAFEWGGAFSTTYWVDPKEKITAQIYTQTWGARHYMGEDFKVLVYQALNN